MNEIYLALLKYIQATCANAAVLRVLLHPDNIQSVVTPVMYYGSKAL